MGHFLCLTYGPPKFGEITPFGISLWDTAFFRFCDETYVTEKIFGIDQKNMLDNPNQV